MVSINASECYSVDTQSSTQVSCIVRLFKIPNVIIYTHNRGMIDTHKIITWGIETDQSAEVTKYNENSGNRYSFDTNNNQRTTNFADANLLTLFYSLDKIELTAIASGTDGESKSDTGLIPAREGIFKLTFRGSANSNAAYRSVWNGIISCYSGFNGSDIVKQLNVTLLSEGLGGPSFNSGFTVTPVFWDGTTETTEVTDSDSTAQIRLKITGWATGSEGSSFKGYFIDETPED